MPGTSLRDLGEAPLKGMLLPKHIFQAKARPAARRFPRRSVRSALHSTTTSAALAACWAREADRRSQRASGPPHALLTLSGVGGGGHWQNRPGLGGGAQLLGNFEHGVWLAALAHSEIRR